jgi:hypothetical protein
VKEEVQVLRCVCKTLSLVALLCASIGDTLEHACREQVLSYCDIQAQNIPLYKAGRVVGMTLLCEHRECIGQCINHPRF